MTLFANEGGGAKITFVPVPLGTIGSNNPNGLQPTSHVNEENPGGSPLPEEVASIFAGVAGTNGVTVYYETDGDPLSPSELTHPAPPLISGGAALVGVHGATNALCRSCEFLKWGAWAALVEFQNQGTSTSEVAALGYWVAGDIARGTELPTTGEAFYKGKALGIVSTNLYAEGNWYSYPAEGKMSLQWNFQNRGGRFNVTKFDRENIPGGLSFGGRLTMPGSPTNAPNQFSGAMYGYKHHIGGWYGGYATGSFVKGPGHIAGEAPAGVMGNWAVGNSQYKAGGIFGGSQYIPHQ